MKNNWDLSDYEITKEIKIKPYFSIIFLIFIMIGIILILCKFKLEVYEPYTLIKNEDDFSMMVASEQINFLQQNNTLYINDKKYDYEITNIDTNYTNINNIIYQSITINLYNYETKSIITHCHLLRKRQTVFDFMIEFIKGGNT